MLEAAGSPIVHSSIWKEASIVGDVWHDEAEGGIEPEDIIGLTNYYLLQMNFLGNIVIEES